MSIFSQHLIAELQAVLVQAGQIALQGRAGAQVGYKSDYTPFTDVELAMESLVISFLQSRFPGDQIVTEETGINGALTERIWMLDPIDGTKIYLNGLPNWGISLGLLENGQPVIGFFYLPKTNELYWGGPEYGAYLNEVSISQIPLPELDSPLSFIAVPTNAHRKYRIDYPRLRSFGSTAAHFCYLAQGAAVGVLTRRINLWDVAGILPILSVTGRGLRFLSGSPFEPRNYLAGQRFPEELFGAHVQHIESLSAKITRLVPPQT